MSIWNGKIRRGLSSHWDGAFLNRVDRDMMVAISSSTKITFAATYPFILKQKQNVDLLEGWLANLDSPAYPESLDFSRLARGAQIYQTNCADCHGTRAERYGATRGSGSRLGSIFSLSEIQTDPFRLNAFTPNLINSLQPFITALTGRTEIVKTAGYISNYLDGIYLRAPYLHNGSVPTLFDLLSPPSRRPMIFYRGSDILDHKRVGFLSRRDELEAVGENVPQLFRYDTSLPGNFNQGHDITTQLKDDAKMDLIEYLKSF